LISPFGFPSGLESLSFAAIIPYFSVFFEENHHSGFVYFGDIVSSVIFNNFKCDFDLYPLLETLFERIPEIKRDLIKYSDLSSYPFQDIIRNKAFFDKLYTEFFDPALFWVKRMIDVPKKLCETVSPSPIIFVFEEPIVSELFFSLKRAYIAKGGFDPKKGDGNAIKEIINRKGEIMVLSWALLKKDNHYVLIYRIPTGYMIIKPFFVNNGDPKCYVVALMYESEYYINQKHKFHSCRSDNRLLNCRVSPNYGIIQQLGNMIKQGDSFKLSKNKLLLLSESFINFNDYIKHFKDLSTMNDGYFQSYILDSPAVPSEYNVYQSHKEGHRSFISFICLLTNAMDSIIKKKTSTEVFEALYHAAIISAHHNNDFSHLIACLIYKYVIKSPLPEGTGAYLKSIFSQNELIKIGNVSPKDTSQFCFDFPKILMCDCWSFRKIFAGHFNSVLNDEFWKLYNSHKHVNYSSEFIVFSCRISSPHPQEMCINLCE